METVETQEKTFTQEEVNAIVSQRLERDRAKYADYDSLKEKATKFDEMEEARKTELQKATEKAEKLEAEINSMKEAETIRTMKEQVSKETGVPISLLTASSEEECRKQAQDILGFAKVNGYPQLKDGGEVTKVSKPTTRQQFAEWAEKTL